MEQKGDGPGTGSRGRSADRLFCIGRPGDGSPLERGETLGFWVEHPGPVTVEAFDPEGRSIGRCRGTLGEAQVTVTLEGGRLVWTEAN